MQLRGGGGGGCLTAPEEMEGKSGKNLCQHNTALLNMKNPGLLSFRLLSSVICPPSQILGRICRLFRGKMTSLRLQESTGLPDPFDSEKKGARKCRWGALWVSPETWSPQCVLTSENQGLPSSADTFINLKLPRTLEEMQNAQ